MIGVRILTPTNLKVRIPLEKALDVEILPQKPLKVEVGGEFYKVSDCSSQSKVVSPTFENQTINPDEEYSFLSSVEIEAIKVTRTENEAGGVTVTIG